jgi:predicted nucleotidyltransferase
MDHQDSGIVTDRVKGQHNLLRELARLFAAIPEVEGVALGGSTATGQADTSSDIDLYIYSSDPVPLSARSALSKPRAERIEVGNHFFESGDEWDERETGIHIDIMYRDLSDIQSRLDRVLVGYEASIGYTTCVWHNVLTCRTLFDRSGRLDELKRFADRPYPDELAKAIVAKNHPLLRDNFGAFGGQILKAAQRNDVVSVNHRIAAFLASYFDIIFAASREPHPGEKRLLPTAGALPRHPPHMQEDIERLLYARTPAELGEPIDSLANNLGELLARQGLAPERSQVGYLHR